MLTVRLNAVALRNNLSNLGLKFQENKDMKACLARQSSPDTRKMLDQMAKDQTSFITKMITQKKFDTINDPESSDRILVEKDTGLAVLGLDGKLIYPIGRKNMGTHTFPMDEFIDKLISEDFEGYIKHPYLDSNGNVTIGAGILISSPEHFTKLQNEGYMFLYQGKPNVTLAQFESVFVQLKEINSDLNVSEHDEEFGPHLNEEKIQSLHEAGEINRYNFSADAYESVPLSLSLDDSKKYARHHTQTEVLKRVTQDLPDFQTYPPAVQMAIADLIYNIGIGKFRFVHNENGKATGKISWPKFKQALAYRDFYTAGEESSRRDVSQNRNKHVKDLLKLSVEPYYLSTDPECRKEALQIQADLKTVKRVAAPSALLARYKY